MSLRTIEVPQVSAANPGFTTSLKEEHDYRPLRIEGALPDGLSGTLMRNGPGLFERFGQPYSARIGSSRPKGCAPSGAGGVRSTTPTRGSLSERSTASRERSRTPRTRA